jgi:drug/metabolite transporter (DMT)-like permease
MPSPAIVLGLLAAITWGAADFAGGLGARRAAPSRVVLIAHGLSLILLAGVSLRMPASLPPWATTIALLSGIAGGVALMVFYEALSLGAMGLSAALAGLLTAVLPVVLGIRSQGPPSGVQVIGFLVAAAAIVLIAYAPPAPGTQPTRRALLFAVLAGSGFGLQLVWLHSAAAAGQPHLLPATVAGSATLAHAALTKAAHAPAAIVSVTHASLAPVIRALMLSRLGGTGVALTAQLLTRARHRNRLLPAPAEPAANEPASAAITGSRMPLPVIAALAGLLDTAGNALYMLSSLGGRLDVAAVLSSLYPGATIVLAALILHERATRLQAAGMGLALAAVALIAA